MVKLFPIMAQSVTMEEAREEIRQRVSTIFSHYERLRAILERHESTIQKRWLKRNREQRRKLLLTAWPDMLPSHRPDFETSLKMSTWKQVDVEKIRDAFMFPNINQEDLLKPKTMLVFLNARGRNAPETFAMHDFLTSHLGRYRGAIKAPAVPKNPCVMMLVGRTSPETYGELRSWGLGLRVGDGLLILRTQESLLRFLVRFCEAILQDISMESLVSDNFLIQPEPISLSENTPSFQIPAILDTEAEYRRPAEWSLSRIITLVSSMVSAARDRIWALREDPAFFADILKEYRDHRPELLGFKDGRKHPFFEEGENEHFQFWVLIVRCAVGEAYLFHEQWSHVLTHCFHLQSLYEKYADEISVEEELPIELLDAFLKLWFHLCQGFTRCILELVTIIPTSPPMRKFFCSRPNEGSLIVSQKPGVSSTEIENRLLLYFQTFEDDKQRCLLGPSAIMEDLERFLQSEPEAKKMISPFVARVISTLGIIAECFRQLHAFQPWGQEFNELMNSKMTDVAGCGLEDKIAIRCAKVAKGPDEVTWAALGNPSSGGFDYPVGKKRTYDSVVAMRKAEDRLDSFWNAVDGNSKRVRNGLKGTVTRKLLTDPHALQRTPPWVENTRPVSELERDGLGLEDLCKPMSNLYLMLECSKVKSSQGTDTTESMQQPKACIPANSPTSACGFSISDRPFGQESDQHPSFAVDARALKVFKLLFYTPSVSATPGDLPWADFLHGMISVGLVPEKLPTSGWLFSLNKPDEKISIQFHEPWPSGRLPYKTVRLYGRRLYRAFGWTRAMFVPTKKDTT